MHYYLIREKEMFERGLSLGSELKERGLVFKRGGYAAFLSGAINSRTDDNEWSWLYTSFEKGHAASMSVEVYASNDGYIDTGGGGRRRLCDFIKSEDMSLEEKKRLMRKRLVKSSELSSYTELLSVKGRYLWILIEAKGVREDFSIDSIYAYFGARGWENYLPEIYRREEGGFLKRYLAVFQTVYEEAQRDIRNKSRSFDPAYADREFMEIIAGWIKLAGTDGCSDEVLRRLLENAAWLCRKRGTREGLLRAAELYLGEPVWLLEYKDLYKNGRLKRPDAQALYDIDEYTCILVINSERASDREKLRAVKEIAESMLPAEISVRIIPLSQAVSLGGYNYLGMNTSVDEYRPARLDGSAAVSFVKIGEGEEKRHEAD